MERYGFASKVHHKKLLVSGLACPEAGQVLDQQEIQPGRDGLGRWIAGKLGQSDEAALAGCIAEDRSQGTTDYADPHARRGDLALRP